VKIALNGAATVDGDLVRHNVAKSFDDGALHFIQGAAGIDNLAAHIAGHPDFVNFDFAFRVDAQLDHLREISAVRELEAHTHPRAFWQCAGAPSRFFRCKLEDATHARRVSPGLASGVAAAVMRGD